MPVYDFALKRADGDTFQLSEHRGKVILFFFGYTHCPDFCPTTLADFNRIYTALGEQAGDVVFVFITVDPERDTPEKVAAFAQGFNPAFIGLSGTPEELAPIYDAYFVYAAKSDQSSGSGYLVDHSTRTIVIDRHGDFRATFPYGLGVEAITSDVRFLLSEPLE
jgi:protein SCO1/2